MAQSNKVLWNDDYLKRFVQELLNNPANSVNIFWETSPQGDVEKLEGKHITKMLMKFYPSLGVNNLILGNGENGAPTSTLIFHRDNRCEEIDVSTLRTITYKIFNYMGNLGDELRGLLHNHHSRLFNKDAVRTIPDLEGRTPFSDKRDSAFRYFQNGWIEITADGVSNLRSYKDIPEDCIVWNSSVIAREYKEPVSLSLLERKLAAIQKDSIHPDTGETIYDKKERKQLHTEWQKKVETYQAEEHSTATHFKDFVRNLAKDEEGIVDENALKRLEVSIGYLCHRFHIQSERKYVLLVDKFYDGAPKDESNGGNGKSLLAKCLGEVMTYTELNGRSIKKDRNDMACFAQVTPSTELVHIDDASRKFPAEILFTATTNDFHIRRLYKNPFSIPAEQAPKIVVSSNFPLEGVGNSYRRREFVVEVGNYYRLLDEEYGETPFNEHGFKHLCSSEWSDADWVEFYRYVFECLGVYLASGLPKGGESDYYKRARLIEMVGSEKLYEYLINTLEAFLESGEEQFAEVFYKNVRYSFPEETEEVENGTLWRWLGEIGKVFKMYPNKHKHGKLEVSRLSEERWDRWIAAGMKDWEDKNGNVPEKGAGRVQTFKVSSFKKPETIFTKPEFNKNPIKKQTKKATTSKKEATAEPISVENFIQEAEAGIGSSS